MLKNLGLAGSTLVLAEEENRNLALAARNIPTVGLTTGREVNSYELLKYDHLLFTQSAFEKLESRLVK